MKTAVVYYSMSGNTALAAKLAAQTLGADLIEVKPEKAFPDKGVRKFIWGGKSAVMAQTPKLLPYSFEPERYERILIASPIWASTFAPPIRSFLTERLDAIKEKQFACIFCSLGGETKKALEKLTKLLNLADPVPCLSLVEPRSKPEQEISASVRSFCEDLDRARKK